MVWFRANDCSIDPETDLANFAKMCRCGHPRDEHYIYPFGVVTCFQCSAPRIAECEFKVGDLVAVSPDAAWKVCRDCISHSGGIYYCGKHQTAGRPIDANF